MQINQSAVLDVGSSKITAIIAERGINNTFIIKARKEFYYDGFMNEEFLNVEQFKQTVYASVNYLISSADDVKTIYVGVPGEFTKVFVKESQISFAKKKKITAADVDSLFDSAFVLPSQKHTLINRSAIVYELNDYRRLANPVGQTSEILKAKLSFVLASNYFIELVNGGISFAGAYNVEYVAVSLAEAMYLLDSETRDRIAIIVDVGYISSTFSLIQGDGIIYQKSFSYGSGFITGAITEKLEIDFEVARELKHNINLCRNYKDSYDLIEASNGQFYNSNEIREVIFSNLDTLCENISSAMENSGYVIPEYVPILITGGGIEDIRGARERISDRLCSTVEIIAPKVPLMSKPSESSALSLLDLVLSK